MTTDTAEDAGIGSAEQAATKTRLVIQKMVLENFKSYANAIEIGPFHRVF